MIVRMYGHVGHLTGYGHACRELCAALVASGIDLEIRPLGPYPSADDVAEALAPYEGLIERRLRRDDMLTPKPDAMIVHTLPMDCATVLSSAMTLSKDGGYELVDVPMVAYTTWEAVSDIPAQMAVALAEFDQVWVPSTQTARCVDISAPPPSGRVKVIPHAFNDNAVYQSDARSSPGPWRFYYMGAWTSRKNPAALLRAWAATFHATDPVVLTLYCPGASQEAFATALAMTGLRQKDMAPIIFRRDRLSDLELRQIHTENDVYVTATRGEAWNLPAFDAMLARRHIIHPSDMGANDYLSATSAVLYGGMRSPAHVDVSVVSSDVHGASFSVLNPQGMSSRSFWLEPDLVQLARAMRVAFDTKTRDLSVLYNPRERYGYEAVGTLARMTLEAICD